MAELAGMRRGSLVDEIIERLRDQITSGTWPVGQRIPPESELIERLQVGRGTLREAVKALSHAGLLEVRQGDGTYVKTRSELSGAFRRQIARSSDKHVQEVRRALEAQAALLAANRRTEADLAACEAALAERDEAAHAAGTFDPADLSWVDSWVRADIRFHQCVVAAAHNPMLLELYLEMADALASVLTRVASEASQDAHMELRHHVLLRALRERDPERAVAEAMHILEEDLD
ncbi:MAG: FadR/GntR family transcriptional regulator [Actinocrinis sp.]